MITMKCCNNSEHIRFENLLKEGCEYKSKKKKLISDFQINTCKINEIQLGFVVRRFQRQTLSNVWPNIDFPSEEGLDAQQHGDHIQQNQLNINALGDHHKSGSLLMTAVSSTIILPLSILSIIHLTRLPRLIRPNWPPHPTRLTELLKHF